MASLHPSRGGKGTTSRRGRGSTISRGPRTELMSTGTEMLEQFLAKPQLVVVEQPKERGMRFRYECEGRSAGSILGASSTEVNKTLPAIELQGPTEGITRVSVTVSLVTKDLPYRPHPHCLVGKDCTDGICVIHFNPQSSRRHVFSNLGIQCIRRKEVEASLQKRREINIDPFSTGNTKGAEDLDLNTVRLCFQCELQREDGERVHLAPVLSNPIYDKKATTTSELKINRLNVVRGPCTGKTEIYMLCDKVQKDDIEIIFSLGKWQAKAEFAQTDVHRQIAIVFKSPPFEEQDITEEKEVDVFLRRLSDRMESEPVKFTYLPYNSDPYEVNRKRKIKKDVVFTDRCSVTAPGMVAQPGTSQQFDQFPLPQPLPSADPIIIPPQEDQAPYPCEDNFQEDYCPSLSPEDMNTILSSISYVLEQNPNSDFSNALGQLIAETDSNSNFAVEGTDAQNFNHMGVNTAPMNFTFYNDVQFNNMVTNQSLHAELDGSGFQPQELETLSLTQVKTESENDHI
ncbi:transcription factor RelB [Chanos chanos]|uniref:Transcription factor RelB n=1 Tax=Chanos chanos TaxID=29144 RepID=A0A6J2VJT7_CHACN|nr:transcription factor RelB [Chanos chanos]